MNVCTSWCLAPSNPLRFTEPVLHILFVRSTAHAFLVILATASYHAHSSLPYFCTLKNVARVSPLKLP